MFGLVIMVAPTKSTQEITKVYLPKTSCMICYTDKIYEGGQAVLIESPTEKLPLFVKSGAIIPMQKLIETTAQEPEIHCSFMCMLAIMGLY
jgi:alpha-glucosidase